MKKYLSTGSCIVILALLLLVNAGEGWAQNQNEGEDLGLLTLEETIELAQDQSPLARAAYFARVSSEWQYRAYRANLLPSLELSGNAPNYRKSIFPNTLDDGTVVFSQQTQSQAEAQLSVNQRISATGGTLSLSSGLERLGIFGGENSYLWQSTPLVISLDQPIFQFNEFKWQNRIQPLQHTIAQKEYAQAMERIARDATRFFFDVYLNQIILENAQLNVSRNDSIYHISQSRYNVGNIAENEVLQTELALRNAEAARNRGRLNYNRVLNEFKIFLGYSTDVTLELEAPEELPEMEVDISEAVQYAMENNSEALIYELQEVQADQQYAFARSQSSLNLSINGQYGLNQTSTDFRDLYSDPVDRQFFTVGFSIPIFNWGRQRALVNMARNEQQEVSNQILYQRRQFVQEVEYTVGEFLQLRGQVELSRTADEIAQRRYLVAQNRYLVGDIDITNLFIAQREKDDARVAYVRSLADFWSGWYNLRRLTLYDFQNNRQISYDF